MHLNDSLCVAADDFHGCHFRPLLPGPDQIPPNCKEARSGRRFFSSATRQSGKKLNTGQCPNDDFRIFPIPGFCAGRSLLSNEQGNNAGRVPKSHQPLRRSSSKSCSTLPGTFTGRRFESHCAESPLPRRMSPLRSRRAMRSSSDAARRAAFCKGMIWAIG